MVCGRRHEANEIGYRGKVAGDRRVGVVLLVGKFGKGKFVKIGVAGLMLLGLGSCIELDDAGAGWKWKGAEVLD